MFNRLPKNQKIIIGVLGCVCLALLFTYLNRTPENAARPDQPFNIAAFGTLPDLNQAMRDNGQIDALVQKLLSYDEAFMFANYRQVNNDVAALMFLWAGISQRQLSEIGAQRAIEIFIRRAYGLPNDEPIIGNPLLEENPWGDLFNRFKAQILMQGQGHKIYKGLAYFDNETNQMVIRGDLSKSFMNDFAEFLNTQSADQRRRYINNLLLFIRETKGLQSLNTNDKKFLQSLSQ